MILDTLPAAKLLSSAEKRQLAEELWATADEEEGEVQVDATVLQLLEQRLTEYQNRPEAVSSWDEVKRRVFGSHAS